MKKIFWYAIAVLTALTVSVSCKHDEPDEVKDDKAVAELAQADLVTAAAEAYAVWEDDTTIPAELKVGSVTLTIPQYQYALAKLVTSLAGGDKNAVKVYGYKAADHPDRDSYDQDEIAVTGGQKVTEGTEDLADLAKRFLAATEEKLTVPNQVLITRSGKDALAFSTNRLTVTMLRTIAAYKTAGSLPKTVSTEYLSAASSLKGFAQQFVGILDIWEKTVGTVSADGKHCTDNGNAWENVHFVPVPWSGGAYADGVDQYDPKYQPYFTVTIDGVTYTSAQTWGIALRGIMDMITVEGSKTLQKERNTFIHTMGNGASFKEAIPAVDELDIWGMFPWYENTDDGDPINKSAINPYIIARTAAWFLTRQQGLGKIGNYQIYGTDPDQCLIEEGYSGFICSMRMWLIAARFYKYLLDNNITENVYDAVKDVEFDTDLYGVEMPDIELRTKDLNFTGAGESKEASFKAKKAWTATASDSWITVAPASGDASDAAVVVNVETTKNETGAEREGTVTIKGGNVTDGLVIKVKQDVYVDPSSATIKEFAQEYVTILNVWANTTDMIKGENYDGGDWNVENAHYVPSTTTITVGEKVYNIADMWETALRSYLLVRGYNGLETEKYGAGSIAALEGGAVSMSKTQVPETHKYAFGASPYNESDGNGGHLVMGSDNTGEHCKVKLDILDNWAMRSLNFQHGQTITNLCGYAGGQLAGYYGCFCSMRGLLTYAFFFQYMLDNNLENAADIPAETIFRSELFGDEGGDPIVAKTTIKDFAKGYVTTLDAWAKNTGTIKPTGADYSYENIHVVPADFTFTVNGVTYTKAQANDVAMQALQILANGGSMNDAVPEARTNIWAPNPYAEGQPKNEPFKCKKSGWGEQEADWTFVNVISKAQADRIAAQTGDAKRCVNFYYLPNSSDLKADYEGYACTERFNLVFVRTFKYILDNNITTGIPAALANAKISADLFGSSDTESANTLKAFAKEFVKVLDVWNEHVGNIDADGEHLAEKGTNWKNVHFIPTCSNYKDSDNNKYPETTITVGDETYTMYEAWGVAIKGIIELITVEGTSVSPSAAGSPVHTLGDGKGLDIEIPAKPTWNKWAYPWYELEGDLNLSEEKPVTMEVLRQLLPWWLKRAGELDSGAGRIGNFQTLQSFKLSGYTGTICPMRVLLIMARFYKTVLDANVDSNIYTFMKDKTIDYTLY